jgi:hypothetical protein
MVELIVAITLIALVAIGFTASVGAGFRSVVVARQRQTAVEIASARLEHLRSIPYDQVALSTAVSHDPDDEHPDWYVSTDNTSYDVTGEGDYEPLIVDTTNGLVLHLEDPVKISKTVMEIYQYATWVDDPDIAGTQNYRRVTVVVRFKAPANPGVNMILRSSSIFTPGSVTLVPGSTTTVPSTSTTVTTAPATTTTTASSCPGDTTAPTAAFTIGASGGAAETGYTASTNVNANLSLTDPCSPLVARLSNDGVTYGSDVVYDASSPTVSWSLSSGDGLKTIHMQARDGVGNATAALSQQIVLDTVKPTTPGTLSRVLSCSGANRSVTLAWGVATDTNLRGYRVYQSTNGVTFDALGTTSSTSYATSHKKSLDTVRYYIVAYDKAGNESDATNTISLAKNECS